MVFPDPVKGVPRRVGLRPCGLPSDYAITLDHRGHTHSRAIIFHAAFHANHFAQSSDEHFWGMSYLRREGERDIEFRARFEILVNNKIQSTSGNIAGLALL